MNDIAEIINSATSCGNLRHGIQKLEDAIRNEVQHEIEPVHYFANGLYCREITIPKGMCLTGKIHKTEHINIISKGDISIITEDGTARIKAPHTIVSKPGTKRAGYAHEETVWTTIHPAETRDLEELERVLIAETREDYLLYVEKKLECDL